MNDQIGFIGGGNMAQAIITGLLKSGRSSSDILVSDPDQDCRKALTTMGITSFADSAPVMAQAHLVVREAQIMDSVLTNLVDSLKATHVIISIAAGISIQNIRHRLNDAQNPVVRVMPNTPALIGEGMSALVSDQLLNEVLKPLFNRFLTHVSRAMDTERAGDRRRNGSLRIWPSILLPDDRIFN